MSISPIPFRTPFLQDDPKGMLVSRPWIKWFTQPDIVSACLSRVVQVIPDSTWTPISFDPNPLYDYGQFYDPSNPSVISVPTNGIYLMVGNLGFAPAAAGTLRLASISLNSTIPGVANSNGPISATTLTSLSVSWVYRLRVSDVIRLVVGQDSGGDLNAGQIGFQMHKLVSY